MGRDPQRSDHEQFQDTAVADPERDPFGEVYEGEWQYASAEPDGETPTVDDLRKEGIAPDRNTRVGPRAGDVFQQGVSNLLDRMTQRGLDAARDYGIDLSETGTDAVQARNKLRAETLDRLQREGWQVVQSKPGSIADMAGYDIIMVDKQGRWFPIDTTLNAAEKNGNALLVQSTRRPFERSNRTETVTLKTTETSFPGELVDQIAKVMKNVGGADGSGFPNLADLRPPALHDRKGLSHEQVLAQLREYQERLRGFDGGGNAIVELEKRVAAAIKHRQGLAKNESSARDTVSRNLEVVIDDYIARRQKGENPTAKTAPDFAVGNNTQNVQLVDGKIVVTRASGGHSKPEWSADSRTELNIGELDQMVEKMVREKVTDPTKAQAIIDHLQANPDARKHIFNELGKQMTGVTDITGVVLPDKTDLSRRRPVDAAERAQVRLTDRQLGDFFRELAGDYANRPDVTHDGWDHLDTKDLVRELQTQQALLSARKSELALREALNQSDLQDKAERARKSQTQTKDVVERMNSYPAEKMRLETAISGKGNLQDSVNGIEAELTKRAREAFEKVVRSEQSFNYSTETQQAMDQVREKMRITFGDRSETVFRDKTDAKKEYRLADLAPDGRVVYGPDGSPKALKMRDGKEIALTNLSVEMRISRENPQHAQRDVLRQLVELDHAISFDERREGGTANKTPAEEQARRDKEHMEQKVDKRIGNALEVGERRAVLDAVRSAIGTLDVVTDHELIAGEAKEILEKSKGRISDKVYKELAAELDKYEKGDAAVTEKLKKEITDLEQRPPDGGPDRDVRDGGDGPTKPPPKPPAPARDTNGAVQETFDRLSQRLQDKLPADFHPDIKDALEQMLEMKRNEPYADELRKLIADYAKEEPAAVKRVNEMLARGKEVKAAGGTAVATAPVERTSGQGTAERPSAQQYTPELTEAPAKVQQAIETFTSADGIKFLKAIPIAQLTSAKVHEKLQNIDKEIQTARENGLHEYAEELKRLKTEYESKKTQGERDAYAKEVVTKMREAHDQASHATKPGGRGSGIAGKAGTTVAVLLVAGWLMDVTAPKAVASPSGPRVMPTKRE